jgi:hypothetical protein
VTRRLTVELGREMATLLYRLARSQRPGHSPAREATPPFADEWLAAYDRGRDVARWYAAVATDVAERRSS